MIASDISENFSHFYEKDLFKILRRELLKSVFIIIQSASIIMHIGQLLFRK